MYNYKQNKNTSNNSRQMTKACAYTSRYDTVHGI